jgi:hypothetical protein
MSTTLRRCVANSLVITGEANVATETSASTIVQNRVDIFSFRLRSIPRICADLPDRRFAEPDRSILLKVPRIDLQRLNQLAYNNRLSQPPATLRFLRQIAYVHS